MERLGSLWVGILVGAMGMIGGCAATNQDQSINATNSFGDDVTFLRSHGPLVVLSDSAGKSKVAISPGLQGRVMTSTAGGDRGASFGWINRQYFADAAAGKANPHISPYGGEDRFWIGPEGGQFSIFFAKGAAFDLEHWFTPKWIDVEPFETVSASSAQAAFRRNVSFTNYSGTPFDVRIDRTVRMLGEDEVWRLLGIPATSGASVVAFETNNSITNTGSSAWSKHHGLLSIWILGMMNATPATTVVIPIRDGDGPPVTDDYFGKVPADRLKTINNVVYFKADANCRSKIGISPRRAKPVLGSYDPQQKVLTICQYSFDESARDYVNSAWKIQDNPFGGDAVNSYNDGPPETGKPQLGKFYELETSSPARELKPGETLKHTHRTMHFQGDERALDAIAKATLGVTLRQIQAAFE
jgi:hypothetical protein